MATQREHSTQCASNFPLEKEKNQARKAIQPHPQPEDSNWIKLVIIYSSDRCSP